MALTQVTGPYPIFTDLDGTPLDDGYLYIGLINQDPEQNPIQVFWDSNLTIPATQPIRTSNGYAYRNGTPALLYTGGEFSITIRNKREEFVLYSPVGYGFDPAAVSASVVKNDFTGDGVQVAFVLSASPSTILATNIFINGVYQEKDSYTLSGNTITFSIAPPLSSSIEILTNETGIINAGNANDISYTLTAPGATLQSVQTKLDQYVSVKDFGAVGDGVVDDTAAVHAAFDDAKTTGNAIYFPAGKYRVTSGYTNSTLRGDITIFGDGLDYAAGTVGQVNTSCIVLDSTSGSSFFYQQTQDNQLTVSNMVFACAQYVLDRKFFVTSGASRHNFYDVNFVSVEQPFVYLLGTYFQMNVYRNIRFTNSGSFHSKTTSLIGTLMLIENCDVEGVMPANSEKIICNLAGIRQIQATNFLIEPAVPSSGWIALFLQNAYDPSWVRGQLATFRGFWIEVTGATLLYSVYQISGRSLFIAPVLNNGATAPFRLDQSAAIEFYDTSFSGTSDPIQNYFILPDYTCQVKLANSTYRNPGTAINNPQFTFDNCSWSPSAGQDLVTATSHNNQQSELLWAFDGGYPDPGRVLVQAFGGTTVVPTVNATFGRGLYVTPSAGALEALFQGRLRGDFPRGGQMFVVVRGTLPTISSGTLEMSFVVNGAILAAGKSWTSADSQADFRLALPITAPTANPNTMGVIFTGSASANQLRLYQLELWIGKSLPSVTMPSFPQNVQTYAAAIPAAGEWARGDLVWNNAPSAGGTPGWVCTTGGTPGTWKAMANLAP